LLYKINFRCKYCGHVLDSLSNYRWRYPTFHLNNPFRGSTLSILCVLLQSCIFAPMWSVPKSCPGVSAVVLPRDKFSIPLHRLAAWISLVLARFHSGGGYKQIRTLLYIPLFLIMQEEYFITYINL